MNIKSLQLFKSINCNRKVLRVVRMKLVSWHDPKRREELRDEVAADQKSGGCFQDELGSVNK